MHELVLGDGGGRTMDIVTLQRRGNSGEKSSEAEATSHEGVTSLAGKSTLPYISAWGVMFGSGRWELSGCVSLCLARLPAWGC